MPERHFYTFPPMDFFGKSIPGVLFTALLFSLLPYGVVRNALVVESFSLAVVVTSIFVVIVLGFTVGQGLNTVAIVVQKVFYQTGLVFYRIGHFFDVPDHEFWNEADPTTSYERTGEWRTAEGWRRAARTQKKRSKQWLWTRFQNLKRIFIPHRIHFYNKVTRHLADERIDGDPLIEAFRSEFDRYQNATISAPLEFPDHGDTVPQVDVKSRHYLLPVSYLSLQNVDRPARFKALYVFCRNTSIALLLFAVTYLVVYLLQANGGTSDPAIVATTVVSVEQLPAVSMLLFLGAVNFLYATGEYKKFYIEYLLMDFVNSVNADRPGSVDAADDSSRQEET